MNIKKIRDQILQEAKPIVVKNGWNDDLFFKISKSSKFKYSEIQALFPEGYIKLLEIYLEDINFSTRCTIDQKTYFYTYNPKL